MMKKLFLLCGLAIGMLNAQAQDSNVFTHMGASVGVGSTGVTIDLSTNVTDYVGVRVGADIMPKIKYGTDIDVNAGAYNNLVQRGLAIGLPNPNVPDKVDVEGKLNNTTGHVLFDFYPGSKIDWHLTVGAYFGPSKVVEVYTKDPSQLAGIAAYNAFCDARPNYVVPISGPEPVVLNLRDDYKIGAQLGDYFLEPNADGSIDAYIKTASFRPYVGIGWGRAVPKNHSLGFSVDLGAQFWGTPKVYCQDKELKASDVEGKDGGFMKTLTKIKVYPTLTFRLTGKFF